VEKINSQANIQSMLQTLRAHQALAQQGISGPNIVDGQVPASATQGPSFTDAVRSTLQSVNEMQMKSTQMTDAYERGEKIPLTDVVLSMQKSSMAFEATLQVRNKVLKAYEDILNMPV
jgi:flagellar hook-basal body complex protein FliE